MKAIKKQLEEINRLKQAISKTNSEYLITDYYKNIKKLYKELKEYCKYRGYDYEQIVKKGL